MEKYIKALIKITSEESHAQDFRNGKLWMNSLGYFHGLEKKEIGDNHEGRIFSVRYFNTMANIVDRPLLCMPIFCLYVVYGDRHTNTIISIPEKMLTFGEYAVVVTDVSEFLNRLKIAGLEFSPVFYYPAKLDTNSDDFKVPYRPEYRKLHEFQYQSEFRIARPQTMLTKESE